MIVAVSGSTGLIGSALVRSLRSSGHEVRRLVRPGSSSERRPEDVAWDVDAGSIDAEALEGVDAVVHLAGEGIGERRWTTEQKSRILCSRVEGTALLAGALASLRRRPSVLVTASGVGYYGSRGDEVLTEATTKGEGFLADVCDAWEAAAAPAAAAGIRTVHARSAVVQSPEGGALARQLPLFRLGVGGAIGSGRQWTAWISLADEVAAIEHLVTTPSLEGPVNVTAPEPVRAKELAKALGRALHRPAVLPIPPFGPALIYGSQLVDELLLASQRAVPEKLIASGFRFGHPTIDTAFAALL